MAPLSILDALAVGAAILALYYVRHKRKTGIQHKLPPGPKAYPIIGNLLDLTPKIWVDFRNWSKEFGSDILYLKVLGYEIVVLNSLEATNDLLDKRSSIYSDRAAMTLTVELMGFSFNLPQVRYGEQWRSQRRLMHHVLHPTAARNFRPHTLKAARKVLQRFLEEPGDVKGHLRYMAAETIMTITYGMKIKPKNDPYIENTEKVGKIIAANAIPGSNLVEFLPFLRHVPEWVPGASFQAKARKVREIAHEIVNAPYRNAKDLIDSGNYTPSFISYCLSLLSQQSPENYAWQEYIIKAAAASLYSAGFDTTASTIIYCVAFLVNYPDMLKRAQEEVDSVIPFGELPTFDDEDKLPFINALCMETMRLKELLPLSVPHRLTEDDVYRGYTFKKGTIVIPNTWAMLHDETAYPDPFSFKPERFLKGGKINEDVLDPSKMVFGYGRRICPGRYMAAPTVWLTVASLVAAFDITKSIGADGQPIKVEIEDNDCEGLLRFPKPLTCTMKPRSLKHEQAIREGLDED